MLFWHLMQSLHIILWVFSVYTALSTYLLKSWILVILLLAVNLILYFRKSAVEGDRKGFSRGQSLVLTILLGFTWWYPLKKNKEFWF
ncbi:MAG: hypothetical protein PQJ58_07175 [Spirochaetales bacterium]|nr:hypothetical protein [Spirochaetales bacterium]